MRRIRNDIRTGASIKRLAAGDLDGIRELASGTVYPTWCDGRRYWQNGYCYVGPLNAATGYTGLPAVATVPEFSRALIVEDSVSSVKMRPLELIATRNKSNALAWMPRCRQVLFSKGGTDSSPALTVTAAGASGSIGTMGTMPANLFSMEGMTLEIETVFSRGATAVGTFTGALGVGGVAVAVMAGITANADRAARIGGLVWAATATTQTCTYNLGYLGQATSGAASSVAITTTSACAITADFASATTSDIIQVSAYSVWIS